MTPPDRARLIMETFFKPGVRLNKAALEEEIRWALVQAHIEALQPPELERNAPAIVVQIMAFIQDYRIRLRSAQYAEQANALQECKRVVMGLERKPVQSEYSDSRAAGAAR